MQLIIDIGNTSVKLAWFDGDILVKTQKQILLEDLDDILANENPQKAIFSSTNEHTQRWANMLQQKGTICLEMSPNTPVPIEKDYETPQTLGTDRLAAAVGATVLFPNQNCLIIDLGTCAKYDWVSAKGIFEGGIIAPGLQMRLNAMHHFTKRLPQIQAYEHDFPDFLGKNTTQALLSGAINGMLAEINGIVERYNIEKGASKVILCGGDAPRFDSRLKYTTFVAPNVLLIGLNRILLYNVES